MTRTASHPGSKKNSSMEVSVDQLPEGQHGGLCYSFLCSPAPKEKYASLAMHGGRSPSMHNRGGELQQLPAKAVVIKSVENSFVAPPVHLQRPK